MLNETEGLAHRRGRMMALAITAVNVVVGLCSLVADPAPQRVGLGEVIMAGGSVMLALFLIGMPWPHGRLTYARFGLIALLMTVLPLLWSAAVAAAKGNDLAGTFRSTVPYLIFVPVGLAGFRAGRFGMRRVASTLVFLGLLHSAYLLALYYASNNAFSDSTAIRIGRITLADPRTTLPLLVGSAILPWATVLSAKTWWRRAGALLVALTSILAATVTQTRSMIAAALVGGCLSIVVLATWRTWQRTGSTIAGIRRGVIVTLLALTSGGVLVATVPPLRALAGAIALRSELDRDSGRFVDEWGPALASVLDEGATGVVVGLGSGQPFVTVGGEERTYVHNLSLYALVYFGAPGLVAFVLSYVFLVIGLVRRGFGDADPDALALAVMAVALFGYAQFFAVHKLFSYNLMLMLAVQGLTSPRLKSA